jgi:hypothetical protein
VALATHRDLVPKSRIVELYISPRINSDQTGPAANRTSYAMATGALPKGIQRPKRGADQSHRPSAEVKNCRAMYLLSSSGEIGSGANTPSYQKVTETLSKEIKRPRRGSDN